MLKNVIVLKNKLILNVLFRDKLMLDALFYYKLGEHYSTMIIAYFSILELFI